MLCCQGVPTVEAMQQALEELGPITTTQLNLLQEHLDVARIGDEGKKLLKSRMLQVSGSLGCVDQPYSTSPSDRALLLDGCSGRCFCTHHRPCSGSGLGRAGL